MNIISPSMLSFLAGLMLGVLLLALVQVRTRKQMRFRKNRVYFLVDKNLFVKDPRHQQPDWQVLKKYFWEGQKRKPCLVVSSLVVHDLIQDAALVSLSEKNFLVWKQVFDQRSKKKAMVKIFPSTAAHRGDCRGYYVP